ncbi:MAG: phosphate-starvation-inducible PsiE family protein [Pseudomonadota bacterium]
MLNLLKRFEHFIVLTLILMMMVVVLLSTIELGWLLIKDIITPPVLLLEIDELLEIFGFFMLVLIGLELLETIRAYYVEQSVHAEIVIKVAMIAIARKIIILDIKDLPSLALIGIAAIVIALSAAYYVIKRLRLPARPEKDF